MYTLIRQAGLRKSLGAETPSLIGSILIAEMFYKFHSFTLECLCFLATWLALSCLCWLLASVVLRKQRKIGETEAVPTQ